MSEHEADRDDEIVETAGDDRFVRFSDKLGSGAFKTVYRGFDTERGIEVAWNQVLYERYNLDLSRVMNEIEVFKTIRNPHIIEFYHAWQDSDAKQVVFITELMPSGTLKQFTSKTPNVKLKVLKNWCKQILMGLDYLHSLSPPIIHRDIKCDNIFINGLSEGEVKIGDFGLATFSSREQGMSLAGTPEFMAPEFYGDQYSTAVDIWAFGMLVIEMVTHEFPYSECRGIHQICGKVTKGIMPSQLERITHPALVDFITLCLTVETEWRPTAGALLQHPFFETESDGDLAVESLLAVREPAEQLSVPQEQAASEGAVVKDQVVQQPLALNTPFPTGGPVDPSGYLSPPSGGQALPPEASLLAIEMAPQSLPDQDGYMSLPQMLQPAAVTDVQPEYYSDLNSVGASIVPVPLKPFQQQDVAYAEIQVPPVDQAFQDPAYGSDQLVYTSDGAYGSDSGYSSVTEGFGSIPADPAEAQRKDLVSAEVVYLNAVNAGDGQLGLRMNIITSDGKEQYTDEVSFDFMLNSDTPASIAREMLRLFDLKHAALPQLEATISERVFYLAQTVTKELPVQLEPDFQSDQNAVLLVDSPGPAMQATVPESLQSHVTSQSRGPPADALSFSQSDLQRDSSADSIPLTTNAAVLEKSFVGEPSFVAADTEQPPLLSTLTAATNAVVNSWATESSTGPDDDDDDNNGGVFVNGPDGSTEGEWDMDNEADSLIEDSLDNDVDTIGEEEGDLLTEDDCEQGGTVLTFLGDDDDDDDEVVEGNMSDSLIVVGESDTQSGDDESLEMSVTLGSICVNSTPNSPQMPRKERSRPRSHTSPMVVPMLTPTGSPKSSRSPCIPSVFASPYPDSNRFHGHLRRESSDFNSSFTFVLPPEVDDIEELESYLDNETSPTKDVASSPTRGSTSDYNSLQNFDNLSTASTTASQPPRSTAAECSNSEDVDTYEYFTDDGVADTCGIYIDGFANEEEDEEDEEDTQMMRLRAKQQLELQRLIHSHERELAAAKQSRRESRVRRASALKKKNAHLLGSDAASMLSDEEGYRHASRTSLMRTNSVPPVDLLATDDSSDAGSVG